MKMPDRAVVTITIVALAIGLAICSLSDHVSAQGRPASTQSVQQALAQKVAALGACNAELGPLQQLSARVLAGELVTVAQAVQQVRAAFEKANPGQTVDDSWKVTDKPGKGDDVK